MQWEIDPSTFLFQEPVMKFLSRNKCSGWQDDFALTLHQSGTST